MEIKFKSNDDSAIRQLIDDYQNGMLIRNTTFDVNSVDIIQTVMGKKILLGVQTGDGWNLFYIRFHLDTLVKQLLDANQYEMFRDEFNRISDEQSKKLEV